MHQALDFRPKVLANMSRTQYKEEQSNTMCHHTYKN